MMTDRSHPLVPRLRFPEFAQDSAWEYATVTPPKKLSSSKYLQEGRFPIIDQSQNYICGWTDDDEAIITKPLPVIVFGDHTCVLKLVDQPFAQGADGIKIITVNRSVSVEYLYYHMLHRPLVTKQYKRHFSTLKNRFICFPNPKSGEQQKIADCLGSLDDLIAAETQKLKALRQQKQGLMQQLFPKPGETVLRLRFPEFENAEPWEPIQLKEVLAYEQPGKYIVKDSSYLDTGTPVLTANKSFVLGYTAETDGIYRNVPIIIFDDFTTDTKYVDFAFKIKSSAIKILTSRRGDELRFVFELISLVRFDPTQHKRYYISQYQNLEIAMPNRDEQQKIADCLGSLDDLISVEGKKLKVLQQHKQGLMQQLFPCMETK